MGERSRSAIDVRFAGDVAALIGPDWQEFEDMARRPVIQEFCAFESRYRTQDLDLDRNLSFMDFNPEAESFTAHTAGVKLNASYSRTDRFLRGLLVAYADRKRVALPDPDNIEEVGGILHKIMAGGVDKVYEYMGRTSWQEDTTLNLYTYEQMTYLPTSLLMLAARLSSAKFYEVTGDETLEPAVPQPEIDEAIDAALQEACAKIIRNERHLVAKDASPADRIFAVSMNCLRTLYHQGKEKGFKKGLINHFSQVFRPPMMYKGGTYDLERMERINYERFATRFNEALGCDFVYPGPQSAHRQLTDAESYTEAMDRETKRTGSDREYMRKLNNFLLKMYNTHSTRHFVDAIADGSIRYSEIVQAMMHLRKTPLSHGEPDPASVRKVWVEWEFFPPGLIEPGAGQYGTPPDLNVKAPEKEREIDWGRIARLSSYILSWGDGAIARTKIPNLPEDKQYYAAILTQVLPDGTLLEHAIADHPEQGHGLYMWRAERGFLREPGDKNTGLTWRDVFCHEKAIARNLGARCFYHTKNLEYNVLDYLTAPPDKLVVQRYAVGKGAVRMARLARELT